MSSSIDHGRRAGRRTSPLARVAAATLLLTALVGVATAPMTLASDVTIPATFFTVSDQQGANDVPSQSDLTRMGRDDTDSTVYKLLWSWDSTDQWTGNGQTGDACALFNFDGDTGGKVDAVVCGQITNPGADTTTVVQNHAPYVFRCDNSKVDRCGQPSAAIPYSGSQLQSGALGAVQALASTAGPQTQNLINDTDPFPTGSNYPNDAMLQVNISKSYLSETVATSKGNKWPTILNPTPVLTNVCSYPSAGNGGNNNPFDCIVNPGTGFLKIVKNAASDLDWAFTVGGVPTGAVTAYTVATSNGTGTSATIPMGGGTTKSVTETAKDGWSLTSATCGYPSGSSTTATGTRSGLAVTGITVQVGVLTTCTFTNTRNTGSIIVKKVDQADAALDGAEFKVRLNGTDVAGTLMTDYENGLFCIDGLPTGNVYDILETDEPEGYTGDDSIEDVPVAATPSTCAARIPADREDDSGVTADRVVTNTRDMGSILILKQDPNGAALVGAAFTAQLIVLEGVTRPAAETVTDRGAGVFCLDNRPTLTSYDIVESVVPDGYSQATPGRVDVTESSTCAERLEELAEALGDENADPDALADLVIPNSPVNADLTIEKTDDRGVALEGAEFTLYVDENEDDLWGGTEGEAAEVDLVDGPLTTDDEGVLLFENIEPGFYCVVETDTPAGHTTAEPQCIEVGLGTEAGQGDDQTLQFENVRTHRVVVLVCHEATDTLDSSDVTLGSTTLPSLAAGDSLDAAEQKALCDTGGASFGGLEHSDDALQLTVDVSSH